MKSDFYVTLPSNASMNYFPGNTQASYRTKLSSPLQLSEEWEVGLSEIIIPRNWFNIGEHNNDYSLTFKVEQMRTADNKHYELTFNYDPDKNIDDFFLEINARIREVAEDAVVRFIPDSERENITIHIREGFESCICKLT